MPEHTTKVVIKMASWSHWDIQQFENDVMELFRKHNSQMNRSYIRVG